MPITVERFTESLFALVTETFEKPLGIFLDADTSLLQTLATVSAEEASRVVSPGRATIAAQAEHVRFYLDTLERYVRGEELGDVDWGEIWRTIGAVTEEEWSAMRARLRESYERVEGHLRSLETWDGEHEIDGAMAIVVHTAYHLGQIRWALASLRETEGRS